MTVRPDQIAAVVLAGGFGTRVQHLLPNVPKPMAPVSNKPFLEWVVRYLARQGIRRTVLSTGHLSGVVARHFARQPVENTNVECVPETYPMGTAGGFLHAARSVQTPPAAWLVLNGDSLALTPLNQLFDQLNEPGVAGVVLAIPMPDASRYGTVQCHPDGGLAGFNEKRPGAGTINAGVYLFRASVLEHFPNRIPLSFEREVFPGLTTRGIRLKVCVTHAPFLDIGTPESLPLAEAFIQEHAESF